MFLTIGFPDESSFIRLGVFMATPEHCFFVAQKRIERAAR